MIIFRDEPVEIEEIQGTNAADAYITAAYWTKTGVDLTADEMICLGLERPEVIAEWLMDRAVMKAEARFDLLGGR